MKYQKIKIHFYRGTALFSYLIRWRTFSPYSHVSIEIDGEIYEAKEGHGVIVTNPKKIPPASLVDTFVFDVPIDNLKIGVKWLKTQIGAEYDYWGVLGFLWFPKKAQKDNKWYCSEFVKEILVKMKVIKPTDDKLSPGRLHDMLALLNWCLYHKQIRYDSYDS